MASITGGGKLAAALASIAAKATKVSEVSVGFFLSGATYPDGTSVPMVAALNEFGVPAHNQPPRPFFRQMVADKSPSWPIAVATLLKANDYDAEKSLSQTGQAVKAQLQNSIQTFDRVPLAPSTAAAKGHDKQLVDSAVMVNSVDFRID